MSNVLAVAETTEGRPKGVALEVSSVARRLANELGCEARAIALGPPETPWEMDALVACGVDRLQLLESEALLPGAVDAAAAGVANYARASGSAAILFGATGEGRDLAPRVAAKLRRPPLSDVVQLEAVGGEIRVQRPVYAGKALSTQTVVEGLAVVSLRPNVFPRRRAEGRGEIARSEADLAGYREGEYRPRGFKAAGEGAVDVAEAEIVVSGGRGLGGPEHWPVLEKLKEALGPGTALGASRAVVDAGWRPHGEQVGQTGKTVTPKLYIAVGVSGAVQHLAGMRTAGAIVAINRDADAPIFGVATYGIVGDLFEVVPALAREIRKIRMDSR